MKRLRPLRLAALRSRSWGRPLVFLLVLLLLVGGGSFVPLRYVSVGQQSPTLLAQPVLRTMLTGAAAVNHAKRKMASKPAHHPARLAFESVLQRPGVRPDLMIVSEVAIWRPQARNWSDRIKGRFLSLVSGGAVHAQDYSEGTIDIWITPFESDSNYGTTEYNELMVDNDTGSWHTTDIQLIIDDTGDPNQTWNQSTGWNDSIAFNCGPPPDHAENQLFDFFTPVVTAQPSYNGINCNNDSQLSWELLRQARNGLGVGVATAAGFYWPCRWTGPGWWACVGGAAVGTALAYVAYEYGSFVIACRCRYMGGQACT